MLNVKNEFPHLIFFVFYAIYICVRVYVVSLLVRTKLVGLHSNSTVFRCEFFSKCLRDFHHISEVTSAPFSQLLVDKAFSTFS